LTGRVIKSIKALHATNNVIKVDFSRKAAVALAA